MIERKRLEELIEQGATVWDDVHCCIKLINNSEHKIKLFENSLYVSDMFWNIEHSNFWWADYTIGFDDLYENEEDSKWREEFGCIERTERLVLPTWEEFNKCDKSVKFTDSKGTRYSMYVFVKNKKTNNCRIIIYADNGEQDWLVFEQPLMEQNYTLACIKCKAIFLGEI